MKTMAWIIVVSFAAVALTWLVYPKATLAVAAIMPGTPP